MFKDIICPTSFEHIDNNASRLTVFINVVLMVVFLITLQPIPLFIVTIDYGIRAFGYNKLSPLSLVASISIKIIGLKPKLKDKAQKTFASRLGFLCSIFGTVFILNGMILASQIIIAFFCILAILDSVFDLCLGCAIYNYVVFPFYNGKKPGHS